MQITQKISKLKIVIISLILLWIAHKLGTAIVDGEVRVIYLTMGLSILIMIPYIVGKIGSFPLLCGLVFIYWIPLDSRLQSFSRSLGELYPTEFGVWMLCVGILIYCNVSQSAQWNSAVCRFPFLPFSLFIGGALITCSISESYYGTLYDLVKIRHFCLLPAFLCFLCIYLIKTGKQAERLLWIFLISAGMLGLVYLYGPQIDPYSLALDIEATGRIRRIIKLPLFGILSMNPETTPVCFAFIVALSFNLWLNHPSFWGRLVAAAILAISGYVIIQGQGRTGLVAAGCSVAVIAVLTLRFRKYSFSSFSKSLWKAGITILLLFGSVWYYANISTIEYFQLRGMTLFTDPLHAYNLSCRIYRWKTSIDVILDNPLGVGIYGFPGVGTSWYAHNLYLYLLLSFGVIGLIGFLWIFIRYSKACWSGLHSDNHSRQILCIGGIGCATVLFVGGIASCICWDPRQVLMVWIPVGITMAAAMLKDGDEGEAKSKMKAEVR